MNAKSYFGSLEPCVMVRIPIYMVLLYRQRDDNGLSRFDSLPIVGFLQVVNDKDGVWRSLA